MKLLNKFIVNSKLDIKKKRGEKYWQIRKKITVHSVAGKSMKWNG